MPEFDPYKILQVDPEADVEVIQAAYRRLARKYHPDLASDSATAERMKALNAAWELVRDPRRRAAHDAERRRRVSQSAAAGREVPGTGASPGMNSGAAFQGGAGDGGAGAGGAAGSAASAGAPRNPAARRQDDATSHQRSPEGVSRDWTSGRSTTGGGYDPATMRAPDGYGAAGPPPGNPSGSVLTFGRYAGWSIGEIGRTDLAYLEWLDRAPIGRQYRDEIDRVLRQRGQRRSVGPQEERRGLFRR